MMKKRALAAVLWFLAGWYAGAVAAMLLGWSPYAGPVMGTIAAALIAGDPFHLIWSVRRAEVSAEPSAATATVPESAQTAS
jgi:hypothetical protein